MARHPLRERLRGQLMLALYRAGRQGDALEAYRQAVRTLDAELGLRPSPELEHLERAILAQDPALRQRPPSAEAPAPERRRATATILFTDLAGSTRMRAELGDEDADAVRREHDRRLRDVIADARRPGGQGARRRLPGGLRVGRRRDRVRRRRPARDRPAGAPRAGRACGAGGHRRGRRDLGGRRRVRNAGRRGSAAVRRRGPGADPRRRRRAPAGRSRVGEDALEDAGELSLPGCAQPRARLASALDRRAAPCPSRSRRRSRSTAPPSSPAASAELAGAARGLERRVGRPPPRGVRDRRAGDRQDAPRGRAGSARAARRRRRALRPLRRRAGRGRAAVRRGAVGLRRRPARSTSCACSSARGPAICCPCSQR